ncbi:TRAP transporter small permease subunit [Pelagibacteraceae bacterium]|jgi:TRAP-type C4-dicarboxylate transport system permease small subunit|nr:TRAP transporter small permease subunit [Pelagibacteraceae bacterium]
MNLEKFKQGYDIFLQYTMFVMMIALATTVVVGVGYRWSGNALVWYDEVASVQLAWLTYYGSAYAALKGAHIGVPSILKSFPIPMRKVFFIVSKIVIYGFFALMTYYGLIVMKLIQGETLTTLEWVPQSLVQSVIPVGSFLFMLSETLRLKEDYQSVMGQGEQQQS